MDHTGLALWVLGISVLSGLVSIMVAVMVLVRLPPDAFADNRRPRPKTFPLLLLRIGKNLIGWSLVAVGLLLSIPGIPGQGILTIIIGLVLVDFPGRRRFLRKLLDRPGIRRSVNRLRSTFGRAPFTW